MTSWLVRGLPRQFMEIWEKTELRRAVARGCWFSVGPAMLAGAKGRSLVLDVPRNRIVLESDGPFAQVSKRALHPWDVGLASQRLAEIWDVEHQGAIAIVRSNEKSLLNERGL
ncbi:TatD family hydrolase [Pseudarthrobacter sp. H2]|uniref:TatD family hydrolase n=1 Tax=Pseudarthrobacter sp. H2 TaxID=3418415 RepID=UPI003CFA99E6